MADGQFTGPYQSIYEAARARLREGEARQRGAALRRASRQGVQTSGVSQIPQDAISREAMLEESELGGRVAQMQESERLQDKAFAQRKELLGLQADIAAAAEARQRRLLKQQGQSALIGQLGGAGLGALAGYFMRARPSTTEE